MSRSGKKLTIPSLAAKKACGEFGHEFYTPTPHEMKLWYDSVQPALQGWAKEIDAKGLPGSAVFSEVRRLIKEHSH